MLPKNNEIYRHFKGNLYKVITLAVHSESGEQMVVYQALYGDLQVYCRPLDMFVSEVDHEKYPDVTQKYRFEPVREILNIDTSVNCNCQVATESVSEQKVDISLEIWKEDNIPEEKTSKDTVLKDTAAEDTTSEETAYPDAKQNIQQTIEIPKEITEEIPEEAAEEIDPLILEFLDAESVAQKRNILTALHHRITDEMINTMAVVMDVVIEDGDIEDRYQQLKTCLATIEKYEIERKY